MMLPRSFVISRPDSEHPARQVSCLVMLLLWGLVAALSAVPAERATGSEQPTKLESTQPPTEKVDMQCVDAEGNSVAGADVFLFQYSGALGRYQQFGPFTADEQGKAVCANAIFNNGPGTFDRWIYARIPGRLVGVSRSVKWPARSVSNPEGLVKLYVSTSVKGQVTVPPGFDCTKVTVRVQTLHLFTGSGDFDFQGFPREDTFPGLDTALPKIFDCHPDHAGRIRFDDVPVRGRLYLVTVGDGLGEAQWMNDRKTFDEPIELTIQKESKLSGRILTPDGKPAVGMKVAARLSAARAYQSTFRALTNANGEFQIRGLPQTEFVLSIKDPQHRWAFRPLENLLVQPAEVWNPTLNLETGVLVSGRVLDTEGKPVLGAGFSAITEIQNGAGLADDSTDADGRYQFRIPSGSARLYVNSLPDGLLYPDPEIVKSLDIKPGQTDIEKLDVTIQRRSDPGR